MAAAAPADQENAQAAQGEAEGSAPPEEKAEVTAKEEVAAAADIDATAEPEKLLAEVVVAAPAVVDLVPTPTATVYKAAAAAPKAVVVEATQPVVENAPMVDQLAVILKDVPPAHQIDINRIMIYIDRMAPKRAVDQKVGCAEQVALYKSIQTIINRQEEYFTPLFSALLFLFKSEMNGSLGDRHRMRFMDNVTLHAGDRKAFAKLTQMLALLADPKSRTLAMKQINMERALEDGLTPEGRNRVLHYFSA